jgi:hypothetical protein
MLLGAGARSDNANRPNPRPFPCTVYLTEHPLAFCRIFPNPLYLPPLNQYIPRGHKEMSSIVADQLRPRI